MPISPEQIIDAAYGPPPKEGQKKLEDFKGKNIPKPEKVGGNPDFWEAKEILGGDFLGPEALKNAFGIEPEEIPEIPFSKEELERAIPVEVSDFNSADLEKDWQKEITRVIDKKQTSPKIQSNHISLVFTDIRQDIPKDQKPINIEGEETENKYSFIEMIKNKVNVLAPSQWIILASQLYQKDKTYLSKDTWDWLMAVVDHRDKKTSPPVSVAFAYSVVNEVYLSSVDAGDSNDSGCWRVAL